jgi:hypothetical protein
MRFWLEFLNIFFLVFHTAWTLFNMVGWAWKRTRRLHLATILLTAVSWFIIGAWYGVIGYCLCTDWHWQVRKKLGYVDTSPGYVHFLLKTLTGQDWNTDVIAWLTGGGFAFAFVMTVALNLRDFRRRSPAL